MALFNRIVNIVYDLKAFNKIINIAYNLKNNKKIVNSFYNLKVFIGIWPLLLQIVSTLVRYT